MTRPEIRTFLEDGVRTINPQMPFGSGRITEWNSNRSNEYPGTWWESIKDPVPVDLVNFILPTDEWSVELHIGKKDAIDSSPAEYEQLVDDCDYIAQKLIREYNLVISESDSISITGITRQPFVKKHADIVTGVILSFVINGPDKTDFCL